MKQTTLLLFGLFLVAFGAKSQSRIGLKAGLNLAIQTKEVANPQMTPTQNADPLVGYQFGVFYKKRLSKNLTLSTEPAFSLIGSRVMLIDSYGKSYHVDEKLGYLELPLTLQYSHTKLYFAVGPSISLKLFSKFSDANRTDDLFANRIYHIQNYKSIDAAGNIIVGYGLSNKIDLNARYSHGIMNVKSRGYAPTKNRFLNFSVLYQLK